MNAHLDWLGDVDGDTRQQAQRALTDANAGSVLMQPAISRTIQWLVNRSLGILSTLPRKPGSGRAFYSQRRTAASTQAAWVLDTDTIIHSEGTYTQTAFLYKTIGGKIRITRRVIRQGRGYADVFGQELEAKIDDVRDLLEGTLVTGDTAADVKSIDGLLTLIGNVSGQTIANTTAAGGDSLYLDKLDETIDQVKGSDNRMDVRIYGSRKSARLLNNALQAQRRYTDSDSPSFVIDGGFRVMTYDGSPVIRTTGMADVYVYNATAPRITAFTGGATSALIVVNTRYVFISELTPMTAMPMDRVSSQYDEADIFSDLVLVLDNTLGGAILGGLS